MCALAGTEIAAGNGWNWRSAVPDHPGGHDVVDPHRPTRAGLYDYLLGGKDNTPLDRDVAERARQVFPSAGAAAQANRAFMVRSVRYLAGEAGIRRFLDIGPGLPTARNLHEVVQAIVPDAQVVYADHDPIVLAHARARLISTPGGRITYVHADVRDPEGLLTDAGVREILDGGQPVALSLIAVAHFLHDGVGPGSIVGRLAAALPVGSFLVLSHVTGDLTPAVTEGAAVYRDMAFRSIPGATRRSPDSSPATAWSNPASPSSTGGAPTRPTTCPPTRTSVCTAVSPMPADHRSGGQTTTRPTITEAVGSALGPRAASRTSDRPERGGHHAPARLRSARARQPASDHHDGPDARADPAPPVGGDAPGR
jgi:hypothetical protein